MSERNKTLALILASGIIMLVLACLGYAGVAGRDISSWAPVMIGFAIPVVTTLFMAAGISAQLQQAETKLEQVHKTVNGNFSAIREENDELRTLNNKLLAAIPPEQANEIVSGTTPSTSEGKHTA